MLAVRVRAVPEDGRPNPEAVALMAKGTGVAKSRVAVVSGATSRVKILEIDNKPDTIGGWLRTIRAARHM